jgi:hypothetical protein
LAPIYRWRVEHNSGINYYYSGGLWPDLLANPDITLEGLKGYALIPLESAGGPAFFLHLWYHQEHGYFYASNGSATIVPGHPPGDNWGYQGVAGRLPLGYSIPLVNCTPQFGCYQFHPPGQPPGGGQGGGPGCDEGEAQLCSNNGGTWDSGNCSCDYSPPGEYEIYRFNLGMDLSGKDNKLLP